jgi:hypothetical protein
MTTDKSVTTDLGDGSLPVGKIQFFSYHKPALPSGDYLMQVAQTLRTVDGVANSVADPLDGHELVLAKTRDSVSDPVTGKPTILVTRAANTSYLLTEFDAKGQEMRKADCAALVRQATQVAKLAALLDPIYAKPLKQPAAPAAILAAIAPLLGAYFTTRQTFTVTGERFALKPADVIGVFPPANSNGDHANVLPHVVLNRSTLPWEREIYKLPKGAKRANPTEGYAIDTAPWMFVITLDDDGSACLNTKTIDLGPTLHAHQTGTPGTLYGDQSVSFWHESYVTGEGEGGEKEDDRVTVVDLPPQRVLHQIPTAKELHFMAHARQRLSEQLAETDAEHAVVLGARLPNPRIGSVSYLVSMECRYVDGQFWSDPGKDIRFVVLKSWKYRCPDEASYQLTDKILAALAAKLKPETAKAIAAMKPAVLGVEIVGKEEFEARLGDIDPADKHVITGKSRFKSLSFKGLLMALNKGVLTVPPEILQPAARTDAAALEFLGKGNVLMPHHFRNGAVSGSGYRSPLAPGKVTHVTGLERVRASDHLLGQDPKTRMLDTTYAAAWQLGRAMMLGSKVTALALFDWKRRLSHARKAPKGRKPHLPFGRLPNALSPPRELRHWIYETSLLAGVPFHYLVPEPIMLPKESIRFFDMDRAWIECMLDGAFSIGRLNSNDMEAEAGHDAPLTMARHAMTTQTLPRGAVSGALVRSQVIAGWPKLQVDAVAILHDAASMALERVEAALSDEGTPLDADVIDRLNTLGLGLVPDDGVTAEIRRADAQTGVPTAWTLKTNRVGLLFHVNKFAEDDVPHHLEFLLPSLRYVHLSRSVALCLFHGRADAIDIHQKPEAIHCGIDLPDPVHVGHFYKEMRHPDGTEAPSMIVEPVPMRMVPEGAKPENILDISALVFRGPSRPSVTPGLAVTLADHKLIKDPNSFSSADFALQMIEGVERVRFMRAT